MTASPTIPTDLTEFAAHLRERLAPLVDEYAGDTGARPADDDRIAAVEELREGHEAVVEQVRRFQRALFDTGLAWPSGPAEFSGMELPATHQAVLDEVLEDMGFPSREALFVGLNIVAPALVHHAAPELANRVVGGLYRGELIGCQLFSEPGAGSDLASVATRAVREGDEWVLNGQKVWTSMGHLADVGEALVRTDPAAPKHAGLTMFLVDMHAPGVTVRPIRQMTGGAAFNEVFLDEVRVPDSARIGGVGEGWTVASTSLGSERSTMSGAAGPLTPYVTERLVALVRRLGAEADPIHRRQIAKTVAAVTAMRTSAALTPGSWTHHLAPMSGSVAKMLMVRALDEIATLVAEVLGSDAFVDSGARDEFAWSEFVLGVPALHLAGGTDEIQRNVIAQRGLGLPRR
ncbi:MAG TPA: acyl-CoA dehydrogenase family protein [Gordonia sp. (in: high G+C Gram-positive bacteria)]|uniref:acyl-CoA dehydrogenase family protein n=1 Tax=unclassified Gordonia (in: high G+C Gram-positive bacteria) TaxID=2657482 RepID=UPI000FBDD1E7|nr:MULTISPECIES: acyl-CoA dehydrogenase family protein [unclassified Gordonia (in: high G+C Gram-positive bacteria)]RUP37800.1 MAG: acyl-CoA dehydrogenase [Gordonia sp. (in: high G+C Gram-positive bacteria)]HNP55343.1 acyl-CoA dehydrogenase family protein [Gordonia sp. (in: high G+C Gram-positive bacteria)]HRC50085.1 acyl-CoA dehydrogenase family protein [Gordonia sp. (in: high G+C Gram-positive bacteria)]